MLRRWRPGAGLPETFSGRERNRGFEAITVSPSGVVYALLEAAMWQDSHVVRMVELDPRTNRTRMLAVPLHDEHAAHVKIGDMDMVNDTHILVIQQRVSGPDRKYNALHMLDISEASDLSELDASQEAFSAQVSSSNDLVDVDDKE